MRVIMRIWRTGAGRAIEFIQWCRVAGTDHDSTVLTP